VKGGTAVALVVLLVCSVLILGSIYAYQSMPVEVQIGERVVCSDPQHQGDRVLKNTVENISVLRREVGKYRVIEKKIVCQVCQERREEEERQAKIRREREEEAQRPGSWKHLPVLLGKTRNEVIRILGQPDDTHAFGFTELISLEWFYAGESVVVEPGWRLRYDNEILTINFGSTGNRVEHVEYRIPENAEPLVKDLLPKKFLNQEPDYKVVFVNHNQFGLQFLIRKTGEYLVREGVKAPTGEMIEIIGITDSPPCIKSRIFDRDTGVYKPVYSVVLKDWLNQKVSEYRQRSGEIEMGIGSVYLGKVRGWELTD
jgi:hypothetical protein